LRAVNVPAFSRAVFMDCGVEFVRPRTRPSAGSPAGWSWRGYGRRWGRPEGLWGRLQSPADFVKGMPV